MRGRGRHWMQPGFIQRVSAISLFFVVFFLIASCGKKSPPTLKSYEKPLSPSLLSAVHREDTILLTWYFPAEKEAGIEDFNLLRSTGGGFERIAVIESNRRSYADTDFKVGLEYRYRIISRNQRGILSGDSNIVTAVPSKPPLPPGNLSFAVADDALVLSWEDKGRDILYNVYKSHEKGSYGLNPANKEPLSVNTFKDSFEAGRPVFYALRSLTKSDIRDEGPLSAEITVDPFQFIPSSPKDVTFFAAPDRVYLYWKEADERWVTGFRVYRRTGGGDYELIGDTQIPAFLDMGRPSAVRDYRINAIGPGKEGPGTEIRGVIFVPD